MDQDFLKTMYHQSPFGFACHRMCYDDFGNPRDYTFLYVNPAFEALTGLQSNKILDRPVTKILPSIRSGDFDWVDFYGKVVSEGKQEVFEQFSQPLKRWYKVHAYPIDSAHFATAFLDITEEKQYQKELEQLVSTGKRHLKEKGSHDHQTFIDEIRAVSGAKYAALNLYNEAGDRYHTVALSGPGKALADAAKALGFPIIGREWAHDPVRHAKIPDTINIFPNLRALSEHTLPSPVVSAIEKLTGIGQVVLVKIMHDSRMIGDFTLFMPKRAEFTKFRQTELYANFFGMVLLRRISEEKRRQLAKDYERVFHTTQDAIFLVEVIEPGVFRYLRTNEAHQNLTGIPLDQIQGKTPQELVGKERGNQIVSNYQKCLECQEPLTYEETLDLPGGKRTWLTTLTPVIEEEKPIYIVGSGTDITQQKIAEQALKTSRDELNEAHKMAKMGRWDYFHAENRLKWSNTIFGIFEIDPGQFGASYEAFLNAIHPDDRMMVNQAWIESLKTRKSYEIEHRLLLRGGRIKWLHEQCKTAFDPKGTPIQSTGIVQDITEKKEIELALQKSEERYRKLTENQTILLDNIQTQVWYLTDVHTYGAVNQAHALFNGVEIEDLAFKDMFDFFPDDVVEICREGNRKAFANGESVYSEEWVPHASGERRLLSIQKTPKFKDDGTVEYVVCSAEDITDRKKAEERLFRLIASQELTNEISSIFVNTPTDRTDQAISHVLESLAQFFNIDRIGIFQPSPDGSYLSNTYEHCAKGVESIRDQLQQIPMKRGEAVKESWKPSEVEALILKTASSEKKEGECAYRSLMVVSMISNGKNIGFFYFDAGCRGRDWSEEDLSQIKFLAEIISNAISKKELTKNLMEARERADAANKAKSQFVSNMSHEIRTPLNGVVGFSELMKNTDMTSEQQEYLSYISSSAKNLLALVNDILDLSKIEAGKMEIRLEPASIEEICKMTVDSVRHAAYTKGLRLIIDIHPSLSELIVETDPDRLRQVLLNLMGNAVKFTQKGQVTLTVEPLRSIEPNGQSHLHFQVQDTGPGINKKDQERLFEDFYQVSDRQAGKQEGTGLGLAISRRILNMMNSQLQLDSQPGEGSTFSFSLKVTVLDQPSIKAEKRTSSLSPLKESDSHHWRNKAHKIMIVEDNPINQKLIRILLSQSLPQAKITTAENGLEAIVQYESAPPDLILMDLLMPEMDGLQATKRIRQAETDGKRIPIIALTAAAESQDMKRSYDAGMDGYLTKPVVLEDLIEELEKWLRTNHSGTKD